MQPPAVRRLGRVEYREAYARMQAFTAARGPDTADEIWLLEHPPVYTVGLAGRAEHLPAATSIPLERIDRGGQITYHGPGQVVMYVLLDLARRKLKVREMVHHLESAAISTLAEHGVAGGRRAGAPGVYVGDAKIAAVGLRIRRGCSYHGIALNVEVDLAPFAAIDPCGYPGLAVTRTCDLGVAAGMQMLGDALASHFIESIRT